MIREVQFPMRTLSENEYRSGNRWAHARATKKQRRDVKLILDSQFTRPADRFGDLPNTFRVALFRLSVGELDDDNLRGSLKAVRDEVTKWLGLTDDRSPRIRFGYHQEKCRKGYFGVKILIEDDTEGKDERFLLSGKSRQVLRLEGES